MWNLRRKPRPLGALPVSCRVIESLALEQMRGQLPPAQLVGAWPDSASWTSLPPSAPQGMLHLCLALC